MLTGPSPSMPPTKEVDRPAGVNNEVTSVTAESAGAASTSRGPVGAPDLHQLTGFLLRRAFVKAVGAARACLTPDEHLRDALVLSILDQHGAISQRHLGEVTGIHQTLVVKLVDGLEATGWVARERNADDRRSYALRLTDAGAGALRRFHAELDRADADFTSGLTPAETARLKELLHQLLEGDPSLDIPALSNRVGYLVARAHRSMRARAQRVLAPLELHPRDFGVLSLVGRDQPCSQRHLAERLGVSPPAVLGFLDSLASDGLVRRARKRGDRRSYDITLTSAGSERLAQARDAAGDLQDEVVRRLGHAGDQELRSLLRRIVDLDSTLTPDTSS
jgi:DNA-binding MarR family transcriptional regulator